MAQRLVVMCGRCPTNRKPNRATHIGVKFSFEKVHWTIDLCDECYPRMEREMYAWGRLGEEHEDPFTRARLYSEAQKAEAKRLSELRSSQRDDVEPDRTAERTFKPMHLAGAVPEGLPEEAKDWIFTSHAQLRMRERNVSAVAALYAALKPEIQRPGHEDGVYVCWARGVKAVIKESTMEILTVARTSQTDMKKGA